MRSFLAFFPTLALFALFPSVASAAPCPNTSANWDINAKGADPTVKALIGEPTTEIFLVPGGDGCFRHHQRGSIYWNASAGTHFVWGAIREKWSALGWERSILKYPVTDELKTPDGAGRFNHFQGGSIYWHPSTGAFEVHGDIRHLWAELGWERSFLRYPITDEGITPDRVGRFNHFQGGSIYWKPNLGPHFVIGGIRHFWATNGWETNPQLGYPITNEKLPRPGSPNRFSDFENGVVYWKQSTGGVHLLGRFPPASRSRDDVQAEAQNRIAAMLAPHGHQAYIDRPATITEISDYSRAGLNDVQNRQIKLVMRLKYHASFLGIDGLLPDPWTDLDLWISIRGAPGASGTDLVMTLTRWVARTTVPAPTNAAISPEAINKKLKDEVLNDVTGKPQVVGTVPSSVTVLSVKVQKNGDLDTFIEPL